MKSDDTNIVEKCWKEFHDVITKHGPVEQKANCCLRLAFAKGFSGGAILSELPIGIQANTLTDLMKFSVETAAMISECEPRTKKNKEN